MSIATIVTGGFGSFGSVSLLPTLGYSVAIAAGGPFVVLSEQDYTGGSRASWTFSGGARSEEAFDGGSRSEYTFYGGSRATEEATPGSRCPQVG